MVVTTEIEMDREDVKTAIIEEADHLDGNYVVINTCYGGFGIDPEIGEVLVELTGSKDTFYENYPVRLSDIPRHNRYLVAAVNVFGDALNASYSNLRAVRLNGTKYIIDEYDGFESVTEPEDIDWVNID